MNKFKSLINWYDHFLSCRHTKYKKVKTKMTDKLKEGLFLMCCNKVLDEGIRDTTKAAERIETLFLTAMEAHAEIFGMEEEEGKNGL
jgi:hypothetical protein